MRTPKSFLHIRFNGPVERQTSVSLQMLGIGQRGDDRCITHIRLDTTLLPEWLHPPIYRPHLSGTENRQQREKKQPDKYYLVSLCVEFECLEEYWPSLTLTDDGNTEIDLESF